MDLLIILALLLFFVKSSVETPQKYEETNLKYPAYPTKKIEKREALPPKNKHKEHSLHKNFIEDKLVEHSLALEHLVKIVSKNEELTKKLVDKLNSKDGKPELPEKLEVLTKYRRSSPKVEEVLAGNPFERFGKNLPKYALLLKDLVMSRDSSSDPIPLVAKPVDNQENE